MAGVTRLHMEEPGAGRYLILDARTGAAVGRVARTNGGWFAYFQDYKWGRPAARMRRLGETFPTRREAVAEVEIELAGEM